MNTPEQGQTNAPNVGLKLLYGLSGLSVPSVIGISDGLR